MSEHEMSLPEDGLYGPPPAESPLSQFVGQSQADFEQRFYEEVLNRRPDYVEVLRLLGHLYTERGLYANGLKVDKRLARLLPNDATAHYNLACSYSLLNRTDLAIKSLRRALRLGYRDIEFLKHDTDLDPIRDDPRYRELLEKWDVA